MSNMSVAVEEGDELAEGMDRGGVGARGAAAGGGPTGDRGRVPAYQDRKEWLRVNGAGMDL